MAETVRVVRHRCGYALQTRVIGVMEWVGQVVIEYRDGYEACASLPLFFCPGCCQPLQRWWAVSVHEAEQMVQSMNDWMVEKESEVGL